MRISVLVVDDLLPHREKMRKELEEYGYAVITANNGKEGFEQFKKQLPDVVISDVQMPVCDGFEFCRNVKFNPDYVKTRFALITSNINENFLIQSLASGADIHIPRPYQKHLLLNLIETLLSKSPWNPIEAEKKPFLTADGNTHLVPNDLDYITRAMSVAYGMVAFQNQALSKLSNELKEANHKLMQSKAEIRTILSNTMPESVVETLTTRGWVQPMLHNPVTIMFTDFVGFTESVSKLKPSELIRNLDFYFDAIDQIVNSYGLEKIKTIGDSYMIASGVPEKDDQQAVKSVFAAMEIIDFVTDIENSNPKIIPWNIRIGISTGEVVAGIIGNHRIAYDLWGDSVNFSSRLETACEVNKVLISESTYNDAKDFIEVSEVSVVSNSKNETITAYQVNGLKMSFRKNADRPFCLSGDLQKWKKMS